MLSTAVVAQASRIDDTHEEKLRFLMRAHEIDDFDDMIRKTLVKQLHHSIAQETRPILGRSDGSRGVSQSFEGNTHFLHDLCEQHFDQTVPFSTGKL